MTTTATAPSPDIRAIRGKFASVRAELSDALIERDAEIDLVLTALLAREHVLLVGAPGSAKSLLVDSLLRWMHGQKFSILLTKFTTPEEVFGPLDIAKLTEGHYRRVTTGRLPEADICFADEIFKSSSAILNTLLRILNERTFENDGVVLDCPLRLAVAASNEWPNSQDGGKELAAVFDRFLFRRTVRPILTAAGRRKLLWTRDHTPTLSTSITVAEVDAAHAAVRAMPWANEAVEAMESILRELQKEGIVPGDRRQFKSVLAAQAAAFLNDATEVQPEHLEVLASVLWDDPAEQPEKCAGVVAKIANPVGMQVSSHLLEVEQILAATDVKDIAKAATATRKLEEIHGKLLGMGVDPRATKARSYVKDKIREIRLGSLDAV